jgi:acetyltransferase-like isoleucine patch superfamily enzyme
MINVGKLSMYKEILQPLGKAKGFVRGAFKAMISGAENFGKHPYMQGKVSFDVKGRAIFGNKFLANAKLGMVHFKVARDATLIVGDNVYINYGVTIEARHEVRIGNDVWIAPRVSIIDDSKYEIEPGSIPSRGPVTIGNNVWLTRNVLVMAGVSIGDGSVIAANSVVSDDIPPNSFAAGSPARVIRELEIPDGWVRSCG